MSLHLVYGKLRIKFDQLWYHKSNLKVHFKITSQFMVFKPTSH